MYSFEKLKQNYEFRRAYRKGISTVTPYFILYHIKGRKGKTRLGITTSKKIGSAVKRNRAKRVITAAFFEAAHHITPGFDFVIVARNRILSSKTPEVYSSLISALRKNELTCELHK